MLEAEFAEFKNVVLCQRFVRHPPNLLPGCEKFIETNQQARVQWRLEQIAEFEQQF